MRQAKARAGGGGWACSGGALAGATWSTGYSGAGLAFAANGASITNVGAPSALTNLRSFTYTVWAKAAGEMRGVGPLLERGAGSDTRKSLSFGPLGGSSPGVVIALVRAGGSAITETTPNAYAANEWAHWTLTYDDAGDRRIRLYRNGVEANYRTQTAATGALADEAGTAWSLGATPGSAYYGFNGTLDEVRIYNRVLTLAEIQALAGTAAAAPVTPPPAVVTPPPAVVTPPVVIAPPVVIPPPAINSVSPTGSGIAGSTVLAANFSRAMSAASFGSTGLRLRAAGASSDVAASLSVSGATATLTPAAPLAAGTIYTATIAASVSDTGGVALGTAYSWNFTTSPAPAPAPVTAPTAAAYWNLNEGYGAGALNSISGNQSLLTGGYSWASGYSGAAVHFNGTGGRLQIGRVPNLANLSAFTWSAWVMPTGEMRGVGPVLEVGQGSSVVKTLSLGSVGGSTPRVVRALVSAGTNAVAETTLNAYDLNVWTHWTMTYNHAGDRRIHLYKNGMEVTYRMQTQATGALTPEGSSAFSAGATSVSGYYSFQGRLDEIRIHDRALTAAEVQLLAAQR